MNQEQADKMYGHIIYQDKEYIVRSLRVYHILKLHVHKVADGIEQTPRSYILGGNYLVARYEP